MKNECITMTKEDLAYFISVVTKSNMTAYQVLKSVNRNEDSDFDEEKWMNENITHTTEVCNEMIRIIDSTDRINELNNIIENVVHYMTQKFTN